MDDRKLTLLWNLFQDILNERYDSEEEQEKLRQAVIFFLIQNLPSNQRSLPSPREMDELKRMKYPQMHSLKREVKNLLEKDTLKALKELQQNLKINCDLYNDVTSLIARYNRTNQFLYENVINYREANLDFNKVVKSFLFLLDELNEMDLIDDSRKNGL